MPRAQDAPYAMQYGRHFSGLSLSAWSIQHHTPHLVSFDTHKRLSPKRLYDLAKDSAVFRSHCNNIRLKQDNNIPRWKGVF